MGINMKRSEKIIKWIKKYFKDAPKDTKAIVGISGGCDSSVVATLLVKALGKERVIGVLMPNGKQDDIQYSYDLVNYLDIKYIEINIEKAYQEITKEIDEKLDIDSNKIDIYKTNTPSRIRMTVLYGISALLNGRVANTCNLSEDFIGYSTKFGDSAGDFSLLTSFTKNEVKQIGKELGLDNKFISKIPTDGMSNKSDEEKLGFSYEILDNYILNNQISDLKIKEKIDKLHMQNLHKIKKMPGYKERRKNV